MATSPNVLLNRGLINEGMIKNAYRIFFDIDRSIIGQYADALSSRGLLLQQYHI
jgi:hypothetical protein